MTETETYWFPKYLARFYIPLPDPLPLHPDFTYIRTRPTTPWDAAAMTASDAFVQVDSEWLNDLNALGDTSPEEPIPMRGHVGNPYGHTFLSAVRIHSGHTTGYVHPGYHQLVAVARRSVGADGTDHEIPPIRIDYSVAEVVVPLQSADDQDERQISQALNTALKAVRNVQRAIYAVKNYPYRLVTREMAPPTTVYDIGAVSADAVSRGFPVGTWTTNLMELNTNFWSLSRRDIFTDDEHAALDGVLFQSILSHPALGYLDFRREAEVALERDGDYRAAAVWAGSAAESMLDTLLQLLMWESGRQPEKCLQEFNKVAITRRVANEFEKRIGGVWNFDTENPVADWKTHVADVRNRVVHSGHEPTYDQAKLSTQIVDKLVSHVCDLLGAEIEKYPRTAYLTMGDKGLIKRRLADRFNAAASQIYGPDWTETFARWRFTHQRLLESDRHSQEAGAQVIFVFGRSYRGYWVLADRRTGQAIRFDVDESSIQPQLLDRLVEVLDQPPMTEEQRAGWIKVDSLVAVKRLRPPWREVYQLVPGQGAMVHGDDISDREFTWRPSVSPKAPPPVRNQG